MLHRIPTYTYNWKSEYFLILSASKCFCSCYQVCFSTTFQIKELFNFKNKSRKEEKITETDKWSPLLQHILHWLGHLSQWRNTCLTGIRPLAQYHKLTKQRNKQWHSKWDYSEKYRLLVNICSMQLPIISWFWLYINYEHLYNNCKVNN